MTEQDPYPPFCQRCMDSHPKGGECIAELEERVVKTAETWAKEFRTREETIPVDDELFFAVEALISARERIASTK